MKTNREKLEDDILELIQNSVDMTQSDIQGVVWVLVRKYVGKDN